MKTEILHKSDCAQHNEPYMENGACDCGVIEKPKVSFETEYQLEQFREIERDHFDENGKAYKHLISTHLCEPMLELINQMEAEIKIHAKFTEG